ncbi:MAG: ABC transporter permease [Halobacteriales archaeon]|nr:ABC transporter permease [Halobacteriales archaeon]
MAGSLPSLSEDRTVLGRTEWFAQKYGATIGRGLMFVFFFYLWAPIAVLVFMSFAPTVLSFPPEYLTLKWYGTFLNNDAAIRAIFLSLQLSLPVTFVSIALATLIAYAIDRYDFPGKGLIQVLATLPIVVPLVVGGVALIFFFGITKIDAGYTTVFIAHVIRTIPFTTLIIVSVFLSFDRTLEEASMDLGADEFRTFRKVTLPNIMPGIIAGGLLAFTVSFNEFVYTFFVKSTATTTLPIYIWERVRYGVTPEVNVISVVFILVAVVLVLIAVGLTRAEAVTGRV